MLKQIMLTVSHERQPKGKNLGLPLGADRKEKDAEINKIYIFASFILLLVLRPTNGPYGSVSLLSSTLFQTAGSICF